jgi:hypothetical protein
MTPNQQQDSFVPTHDAIAQQQLEQLMLCQREFPSLEWRQSQNLPGFKGWGSPMNVDVRLQPNERWACGLRINAVGVSAYVLRKDGKTIEEAIAEFKLAIALMAEQLKDLHEEIQK